MWDRLHVEGSRSDRPQISTMIFSKEERSADRLTLTRFLCKGNLAKSSNAKRLKYVVFVSGFAYFVDLNLASGCMWSGFTLLKCSLEKNIKRWRKNWSTFLIFKSYIRRESEAFNIAALQAEDAGFWIAFYHLKFKIWYA